MRIPNFCYIQDIVFVLSYLPVAAVGTSPLPWINWEKYKNYNLNVTEVLDSDFKNAFPGIFNFTVGILILILDRRSAWQNLVWLQYIGSRWQSIPEMAQKSAYYLRSISFWQFSILWMLSLVLVFLVLHMPVSLNLGSKSDRRFKQHFETIFSKITWNRIIYRHVDGCCRFSVLCNHIITWYVWINWFQGKKLLRTINILSIYLSP